MRTTMMKKRKTTKQRKAFRWTRTEIDRVLNPVCKDCCKAAARRFFKNAARRLRTEERSEAMQSLFIEEDALIIEWFAALILACHTLREELLAWLPNVKQRPGLSNREGAQIVLRGFIAAFGSHEGIHQAIEEIRGGTDGGNIDFFCGAIDAVHELRDDIALWAEPAHSAIN
jgi:hypothetical protein